MIFSKFWASIRAQFNELANFFWEADPIAQMQYEYDMAVEQLKEGRLGLEMYRGLVEKVARQVRDGETETKTLEARVKAYLKAGDRDSAKRYALQLQQAKARLAQNREQLDMHETAYSNNLKKIKHANKKLGEVRDKIKRYDAELKMSEAEAEIAKLSQSFEMDLTTDFGQLETMIQGKIDANRGKARVATDLSERGLEDIAAEEAMESALAEDALMDFEVELGIRAPEVVATSAADKNLGPAEEALDLQEQTS